MELKGSLLPSEGYHSAIGQLYARVETVFSQQPGRSVYVVVAALASADRIEFWRFEREADSLELVGRMQRTSLTGLDMTSESDGCVVFPRASCLQ